MQKEEIEEDNRSKIPRYEVKKPTSVPTTEPFALDKSFYTAHGRDAGSLRELDNHYALVLAAMEGRIMAQIDILKALPTLSGMIGSLHLGGSQAPPSQGGYTQPAPREKLAAEVGKSLSDEQWNRWHSLETDLLVDETVSKRFNKRVPTNIKAAGPQEKFSISELSRVSTDETIPLAMQQKAKDLRALKVKFVEALKASKGESMDYHGSST